jgi:DNA-binding transcriptional regulator YhcF (GntR family)
MSQTRISPDLGPLPRGSFVKAAQAKADGLRQTLRSLAIKNQREQPRVFYSLREVAKQFKAPVSAVAKIYHGLEEEGFLSRMRGSKTILNGLRNNRRLSVRGFVGLPALISNFIAIQEYRTFFMAIRRELWMRGFATTMFFFRPNEAADGTLSDQLKSYEIDTVIWLHPGRSAMETLLRLADMGIRAIVISQVGTPSLPSRYYVWKERAIDALLRNWKDQNSVRKITVVDARDYRSPVTEELLRIILRNVQIEPVIRTFRDEDSSIFLRDLCALETDGVIFPCTGLLSLFAFRSPELLADLLRMHRVAFIDGPIDLPFIKIPQVAVDLVMVNWQTIAESIVNDLITREAFDRNRHTTFYADANLRAPLSSVSEEVRPARSIGAPE